MVGALYASRIELGADNVEAVYRAAGEGVHMFVLACAQVGRQPGGTLAHMPIVYAC